MSIEVVDTGYENINRILTGMDSGMRSMALIYLQMLPPETLTDIDAKLPELESLQEADDNEGIIALVMAFGATREMAEQLAEMRHGFDQE